MFEGLKKPRCRPWPTSWRNGAAATTWGGVGRAKLRPPSLDETATTVLYQQARYSLWLHRPGWECAWYSWWTSAAIRCPSVVQVAAIQLASSNAAGSASSCDGRGELQSSFSLSKAGPLSVRFSVCIANSTSSPPASRKTRAGTSGTSLLLQESRLGVNTISGAPTNVTAASGGSAAAPGNGQRP